MTKNRSVRGGERRGENSSCCFIGLGQHHTAVGYSYYVGRPTNGYENCLCIEWVP